MRFPEVLDAAEQAALQTALARTRESWGFSANYQLADLLESWRHTVQSVESGYALSLSDYERDLMLRDEVDLVSQAVPQRLRESIAGYVAPLDEKFGAATTESPLVFDESEISPRWRRCPKTLNPCDGSVASTWGILFAAQFE